MKILGSRVGLQLFQADERITNSQFSQFDSKELSAVYLPDTMAALLDVKPFEVGQFVEDDNRGAISPSPVATIDGLDFHLSVKGIGSTTAPFSYQLLDREYLSSLVGDLKLRSRIRESGSGVSRFITGELWLRGSPYGGQGVEHASTALRVSEMADMTSINGFRIAPVIRVVYLPEEVERAAKSIYWYRRFNGRIVQELRLVPSNIRVYFHSGSVMGRHMKRVFDMFVIDSNEKAYEFEMNFIRSCISLLTLFPRTMRLREDGRYSGLDFNDVWLDKDAVLAPDGTVFFVDLEGIEERVVDEKMVADKIEEQLHRSLYEFMFAYEQIENERASRFGPAGDRRMQFEMLVREAVKDDRFIDLTSEGGSLKLIIKNKLDEQKLNKSFSVVDRDVG